MTARGAATEEVGDHVACSELPNTAARSPPGGEDNYLSRHGPQCSTVVREPSRGSYGVCLTVFAAERHRVYGGMGVAGKRDLYYAQRSRHVSDKAICMIESQSALLKLSRKYIG